MKINITKAQYMELVTSVALANGIFGILGDMWECETDYKKRAKENDQLEEYLLSFADEFGCGEMLHETHLDDDFHAEHIMSIMDDYEEFAVHDNLANKLGWRDFERAHTPEEIAKIKEEHGDYLGVPLYEYEKKYSDEFNEHGFDRLEIVEDFRNVKKYDS